MSMSEEQILWLAALLHDIGKFRERTADLMKKGLRPVGRSDRLTVRRSKNEPQDL